MQRLLKADLKVIIPYAKEVLGSFPDKPVRIRRDRERFRVLINVITILHQTHRKIEDGKIYSTLADYQIAKILAEETLIKTIFESSPVADILYETIKQMDEDGGTSFYDNNRNLLEGFTFSYQDLADKLGWEKRKVKKWISPLTKNGLVEYINEGGKGQGQKAVLRFNKSKDKPEKYFLPEIKELVDKYPCPKELFYNPVTTPHD